MEVPLEVTLQIFQRLPKSDLKSIRLCCKAYSVLASKFLFHVVYVSTHQADIEILAQVASHPLLSKCVKQLRWDGSHFPRRLSKLAYLEGLCRQLWDMFAQEPPIPHDSPDPQVNELIELAKDFMSMGKRQEIRRQTYRRLGNCSFKSVTDGYHKFMEYANRQDCTSTSEEYWNAVGVSLSCLPNLQGVRIDSEWYKHSQLKSNTLQITTHREIAPTGSPLARSWNVLHLRPLQWGTQSYRAEGTFTRNGFFTFLNVCLLPEYFPQGVRQLKTKDDNPALPASLFSSRSDFNTMFSQEFLSKYERIEILHLAIESDYSYTWSLDYEALSPLVNLQALLRAMPQLKDLRLVLPVNDPRAPRYNIEYIFPPRPQPWQNLHRLEIRNLAVQTASLLSLLMVDVPNLRYLTFDSIQLLDGTWEQVVACMSLLLDLSSFHARMLSYPGSRVVWSEEQPVIQVQDIPDYRMTVIKHYNFFDEIEEYAKYGGEHPMMKNATQSQLNALQEDVRRIERSARGYNTQRSVPAIQDPGS
ncbi:MAG: hypothetical protein Q9203_005631 [Teloschistes exilis]